jgi:hypothetical protein
MNEKQGRAQSRGIGFEWKLPAIYESSSES